VVAGEPTSRTIVDRLQKKLGKTVHRRLGRERTGKSLVHRTTGKSIKRRKTKGGGPHPAFTRRTNSGETTRKDGISRHVSPQG